MPTLGNMTFLDASAYEAVETLQRRHPDDFEQLKHCLVALLEEHVRSTLDIAKRWHRLDFVLRRFGERGIFLAYMLTRYGAPLGPDLGYGPARSLDATRVAAAAAEFAALDTEGGWPVGPMEISSASPTYSRRDPALVAGWSTDDLLTALADYRLVSDYFVQASVNGHAILIYFV